MAVDTADGVSRQEQQLFLPPQGFGGSTAGLLAFAVIWLMGVAAFTALFWTQFLDDFELAPLLINIALFGAGLGMLAFAIDVSKREVHFERVGDQLLIVRRVWFRIVDQHVAIDRITDVKVGDSHYGSEHNRMPELQIHLAGGRILHFGVGRPKQKLEDYAQKLNRLLERDQHDSKNTDES